MREIRRKARPRTVNRRFSLPARNIGRFSLASTSFGGNKTIYSTKLDVRKFFSPGQKKKKREEKKRGKEEKKGKKKERETKIHVTDCVIKKKEQVHGKEVIIAREGRRLSSDTTFRTSSVSWSLQSH